MLPTIINFVVPVTVIGVLLFAYGSIVVNRSAFYRDLVAREIASKRFHALDGLRGYLALGVLFHHVAINYQYYQTGHWALTPWRGSEFFGQGSVAFFFMITAFLFWNRVLDDDGRIDAYKFYVSRLRRTVPMYLVSAGLVVMTVLVLTGFRIEVPPLELCRQVVAWVLFTIPGAPAINGFERTGLVNTVFWSLVYEWKFYLLLPFLAVFVHTRLQAYLAAAAALCIWFYSAMPVEWYFLAGGTAAVLTRKSFVKNAATSPLATFIAIGCVAAGITWESATYSGPGALLLFVPFVIFASGNTVFGLLTHRTARLFGLLSYSVYLLHNWVLFVVSWVVNRHTDVASLPTPLYWALGGAIALVTALLATMTYRFVEYPYLRASPHRKPAIWAPAGRPISTPAGGPISASEP